MANPADTALSILQRAEEVLRRRSRRVVPADEATLLTLAESPEATLALSERQKQQLEAIERRPVTA